MKEHYIEDADGKWKVIEQDNGITVRLLEEPSDEYIAKQPPTIEEPEPRDYLAELDQLKAEVEEIKRKIGG